jgi:hypothetical protein
VIARLEYGAQGNNPRFAVTNVEGEAKPLYEALYCQRGEAQNRIKEVQLDLFGTRASCHKFLANHRVPYRVAPAKPRRPAWNNAFAKNRYVEISQELE